MDSPAFQAYALTASIIAIQLILLAFNTGRARTASKQIVNPEDSAVVKGGAVADRDHPDVLRAQRAHQNALENAVPFFAIGALYVSLGATKTGAQAYCFTFLAARILHTVFYLAGRQPFRTLSFAIGATATLGMAYHVIRAVL